jgi:hypothetical protein
MTKPPQFNIDFSQTHPLKCDECGNQYFNEVLMIRKLSALLSPTGQAALIPIPMYACSNCRHVNEEFLPEDQ